MMKGGGYVDRGDSDAGGGFRYSQKKDRQAPVFIGGGACAAREDADGGGMRIFHEAFRTEVETPEASEPVAGG